MSTRSDTLFPYTTRFRSAACGELSELPGKRARTAPFRELVSTNLIATLRDDRIDIDVAGRPRVEQYLDVGRNVAEIFQKSEEHTSELQSLMRISYAAFCLKKKHE